MWIHLLGSLTLVGIQRLRALCDFLKEPEESVDN